MKLRILGVLALAASVCAVAAAAQSHTTNKGAVVYVAHLHSLNADATGHQASGVARFVERGNRLIITVNMRGVPPGIMHMQHIHGFPDGKQATCATMDADTNQDGFVDLHETEPMSGTTMVPLTADPASMEIATDTYPKASANGTYHYRAVVSLKALEAAFAQKFPGQTLDLARRVVYVHGVLPKTKLPSTVASLGTVPAQVTLPIACGEIERVSR